MPRCAASQSARTILFLIALSIVLKAQTPTLRTTTQLVEIDTIAVDSHGAPVADLKENEVRLYEDGVERPLSHFSFERVEPLDANATKRLHDIAAKQPPGVYANFTKDTTGVPPNGCTVLLIDWQNTALELQHGAQEGLKKFLETVDLSKPLAIFSLDDSLHQIQTFTSDREVLRRNVEKYGLHSANLQREKQADNGLHSPTTDFRVRNAASALMSIAGTIESMRGHKSLIWLSGAFPTALVPTNREGMKGPIMEANQGGWLYGERRNYSDTIEKVSHALSAANIAVYPVDARGLVGTMADASEVGFQNTLHPIQQDITQRQESMRSVAEMTGGRAFYNHNDIGREISSAYEDANTFYAIAFTPARSKPDGKVHAVRIDCRRAGVHLRYRKSYFADDKQALEQVKRAELEFLVQTPGHSADGLPFMAQIDKHQNDRLNLWIDGSSLSVISGQEPYLHVDVGLATFDESGKLLQQNYAPMDIKMSARQVQEMQISGLSQVVQFARTKESTRVRIVLRDRTSGRVGTLEVPLI